MALKHHANCRLDLMNIQYRLVFKELLNLTLLISIQILKLDFVNHLTHLKLIAYISFA